jgi:hypothetical protein
MAMFSVEKCLRLTSLVRFFIASTEMGRDTESKEVDGKWSRSANTITDEIKPCQPT